MPIPPRGSESDSTSSSWSNRSPEEETEDERSPLPSPCPSVKSTDYLSKEPIQTGKLEFPFITLYIIDKFFIRCLPQKHQHVFKSVMSIHY